MNLIRITLLTLTLLLGSSLAFADSVYVNVGSPVPNSGNAGLESMATNDDILVSTDANRSYSCTLVLRNDEFADFSTTVTAPSMETLTATECGDMSPRVQISSNDDTSADNRICFTTTEAGTHTMVISDATSSFALGSIECLETSLYGGYNTNATPFNFLELENTIGSDLSAQVTVKQNDGTVVLDAVGYNVPAGSRTDIDVHSSAGANQFGSIIVTHNGPYGAIQGRVSQYTSDLERSSQVPLRAKPHNF